jgi:DNA-binding NarL/FixJ family response regulator
MKGLVLFVRENMYRCAALDYFHSRPGGYSIAGTIDKLEDLEELCIQHNPEVVVFLSAPAERNLRARMKIIRENNPNLRIVAVNNRQYSTRENKRLAGIADTVISDRSDPQTLLSAILITLKGYIVKPSSYLNEEI